MSENEENLNHFMPLQAQKRVPWICPNCGSENDGESNICIYCHTPRAHPPLKRWIGSRNLTSNKKRIRFNYTVKNLNGKRKRGNLPPQEQRTSDNITALPLHIGYNGFNFNRNLIKSRESVSPASGARIKIFGTRNKKNQNIQKMSTFFAKLYEQERNSNNASGSYARMKAAINSSDFSSTNKKELRDHLKGYKRAGML